MTTKENYTKRYNDVKQSVIDAMDKALGRALGNGALNLDNMADNYTDVYPLIAAALQRYRKNAYAYIFDRRKNGLDTGAHWEEYHVPASVYAKQV